MRIVFRRNAGDITYSVCRGGRNAIEYSHTVNFSAPQNGKRKNRRLAAGAVAFTRDSQLRKMRAENSVAPIATILCLVFRTEFLKELDQPVDQLPTASNHMKPTLVLVLFQNFVQSVFQFSHVRSPHSGFVKPPVL